MEGPFLPRLRLFVLISSDHRIPVGDLEHAGGLARVDGSCSPDLLRSGSSGPRLCAETELLGAGCSTRMYLPSLSLNQVNRWELTAAFLQCHRKCGGISRRDGLEVCSVESLTTLIHLTSRAKKKSSGVGSEPVQRTSTHRMDTLRTDSFRQP